MIEVQAALGDTPRGEVTVVVEGNAGPGTAAVAASAGGDPEAFIRRLLEAGLSRRDAARALAVAYGLRPREAYRIASGSARKEK